MSGQKKTHSLLESLTNVAIGYCIALFTQLVVFPMFGINVPLKSNIAIGAVFTVVSIIRSFALRRFYNWVATK